MNNSGATLWKKAKTLMPGGSQLLSKRSEMFLPDLWPSYYTKVKGVEVWDIDNNKYFDMSIMGVGTSILGYADDDVDSAVIDAIKAGNMSTLNAPEEVDLAELLVKMNPWAGMVRYCRSGGEAMAIAVRIARAKSGKDKVAFCGYHGWHDWYLAANLADGTNLDGQLLPGLLPVGVPKVLRGTAVPYDFNSTEKLESLLKSNEFGVIVLETVRNYEPTIQYLKRLRELSDEYGCVLIFDEITSGFRINVGGAYQKYGVNPDIVVFAKAMGNGYPMAAVVGKTEVMDRAQDSFISSTYWTDKIGPVAALTTIQKMERLNVPNNLVKIGNRINEGWKKLANENDLNLEITGLAPLTHFSFKEEEALALRTLFTQILLEDGFLASGSVYVANLHTPEIIDLYLTSVNRAFGEVAKARDSKNIKSILKGPVAHSSFKRLN